MAPRIFPRKKARALTPLLLSNIVPLLRREAADERAPVRIHGSRRIRDVLVAHPDSATFIGNGGGVVAPASHAVAGAELRIPGEAVVWQCTGAGNPDCACAVDVN